MEIKDIALLTMTGAVLAEVSYLLLRTPRTSVKAKDRAILVDTSVLMDGRITSLAATGFIGGTLVIPRSVVGELQFLADNADAEKRARARQGLDIITELQNMTSVKVELLQDGSKANEGVDERLLTLAKRHNAVICTIDYNLNKVAVVEGITVLNINELAQSLRMAHLPGEQMMLELVQKGQDSHQAVGYLPDGTMVVVEQASSLIGQTVQIEVVRSLQTAAGKMMFARRVDRATPNGHVSTKKATSLHASEKPKASGRKQMHDRRDSHNDGSKEASTPDTTNTSRSNSRPARQASPAAQRSGKRPVRRSVDREAALLDLVDKQQ